MDKKTLIIQTLTHMITQGKPSVNMHCRCLYRGPEGLKCNVGFWIPDASYVPAMEGETVPNLLLIHKSRLPMWAPEHEVTLRQLQKVHDDSRNWDGTKTMATALRNYLLGCGIEEHEAYDVFRVLYLLKTELSWPC